VHQEKVPFNERGGRLRGYLDAISGRFPRFVFGGGVGDDTLPVFHFHDETVEALEPKLRYLAENGYRTVTNDEIADFVAGRLASASRRVGLCFDDAWTSVWTTAAPLLRQYGLTAIVYAIPGRIEEAADVRPIDRAAATSGPPFVTWPELQALHTSGVIDVQCHTWSHAKIFCSSTVIDFVTPGYDATPLLNRPRWTTTPAQFVTPADLGAPLYVSRSRMSDARETRFSIDPHTRCVTHVAASGGPAFFARPQWRTELDAIVRESAAEQESEDTARRAIEDELDRSRSILNDRLRTRSVNHICLPWGVSGTRTADALRRLGYRTAFANRLRGLHAVQKGDHPLWLKRLPNKYITRLPGRGRRT